MSLKWKFITYGLVWGLTIFILTQAWGRWVDHQQITISHILIMLPVWLFIGAMWGVWKMRHE